MMIAPYYFKSKALKALKGNWQTALLVTFFSGVLLTALSVLQSLTLPDVAGYLYAGALEALTARILAVPTATWVAYYALAAVSLVITPVLIVGANHYFVCRLKGEELGFKGLFSRTRIFGRALWLHVQIYVRVFLWALLFVVPGVIAALRYSMAPYYLAENPDMTASEAIAKSKKSMEGFKLSYFSLTVSFFGWLMLSMVAEMLLMSISPVVGLVASQFMQLAVSTYMSCAQAAFFEALSAEGGMNRAMDEIQRRMNELGMQGAMGMPRGIKPRDDRDDAHDADAGDDIGDDDGEPDDDGAYDDGAYDAVDGDESSDGHDDDGK